MSFETPVALIIFNRSETVRRLIAVLRAVQPTQVFVVADGPRAGSPEDVRRCAAARQVIEEIDWPCQVHRRFLDENLGCGKSPAAGFSWIFERVDSCIILEDDCLPHISCFRFFAELLLRYRDDDRVMMISGNNHLLGGTTIQDSYAWTINTQTNGWATWRRAWVRYDFHMKDWPDHRSHGWLRDRLGSSGLARQWFHVFDNAYREANSNPRCSYWDFQWTYCCWKHGALNIIPDRNLVSNIGYGAIGTHSTDSNHPLANLPVVEMPFPLRHPKSMSANIAVDKTLARVVYGYRPLPIKILRKLERLIFGPKAVK